MRSSLVRGYGADIGPVLGWQKRPGGQSVAGKARAIFVWKDNSATRRIAIGTHSGLYVQLTTGTVGNITPVGFVAGEPDATVNTGFGGGAFGAGAFGTPRPDKGTIEPAAVWMLDDWGQNLVACCHSDGRLFQWVLHTGNPAAPISGAPTGCAGLVTTQHRFLLALGASGNGRLVKWCDQENNTVWTPSATNQAGDQELNTSGGIVTAVEVRGQTLILTDLDAHVMQYIGPPFIFSTQKVGEGCGAVSVGCVVDQGDWAIWWSRAGFWRYDGAVTPLDCPLRDLDAGMNLSQRSKITGWHNAKNNEIWWHYPSADQTENDRYVTFNYRTGEWWEGASGDLVRLCGVSSGMFNYPLLMGDDGFVYEHEFGGLYDGATPYARSGPILLGDGERTLRVLGLIPNFAGDVNVGFFNRDQPTSPEVELAAAPLSSRTDLMFSARQVELNVEFKSNDGRFGVAALDVAVGASR